MLSGAQAAEQDLALTAYLRTQLDPARQEPDERRDRRTTRPPIRADNPTVEETVAEIRRLREAS
jgi:hypothetical protein